MIPRLNTYCPYAGELLKIASGVPPVDVQAPVSQEKEKPKKPFTFWDMIKSEAKGHLAKAKTIIYGQVGNEAGKMTGKTLARTIKRCCPGIMTPAVMQHHLPLLQSLGDMAHQEWQNKEKEDFNRVDENIRNQSGRGNP